MTPTSSFYSTFNRTVVTIYQFKVKLFPSSYLLPEWVREWDMDVDRICSWRANPSSFDGSTTLNLKRFVMDLWHASVNISQPELVHFYCYVKKG